MPRRTAPGPMTALVLQGGGARGAYQVGALKALAEITKRWRSPFRIICGASVGAINAASIAYAATNFQHGARKVEHLWRSLSSSSVYDTRPLSLVLTTSKWALTLVFGHLGLRASGGLLDSSPLSQLLERELDRRHLEHAIRTKALHALCITASSFADGSAVIFFEGEGDIAEWSRVRRRSKRTQIGPVHLMASSALPFAFAPVLVGNEYYGDGSLRSTSPLSPAIHTGADRILVVTTRDQSADPHDPPVPPPPPSIGEMAGHALDIMFNDNLEADHERMVRINHTISLLDDDARRQTSLRQISTVMLSPTQDLREIAMKHARSLPWSVRLLLRSLGGGRGDGRMESYLMFEPDYIGELIDLGYADTIARAEEVADFLRD